MALKPHLITDLELPKKYQAPSDQSVIKIPRKLKEAEVDGQYWGCSYAAKRFECYFTYGVSGRALKM